MDIISNLFKYFINANPGRNFQFYLPTGIVAIILIALAIFLYFYIKKTKKEDKSFYRSFKKFPAKLIVYGLMLLIYIFCRYQLVTILSSRLVIYVLLAYGAWLIYSIINTYLKKYPAAKKLYEEQMAKSKNKYYK